MHVLFGSLSFLLFSLRVWALNVTFFDSETRCDDGRRGVVRYIQKYVDKPFQPAIFTVDCARPDRNHSSPSGKPVASLPRIKRVTCMPQACSSSCYASGMSPTMRDCDNLLDYLRNRGQQQNISSLQQVIATSDTCLFRFINNAYGSVTLCDTEWASQSDWLATQCFPRTPGGLCTNFGFQIDVGRNPNSVSSATNTLPESSSVSTISQESPSVIITGPILEITTTSTLGPASVDPPLASVTASRQEVSKEVHSNVLVIAVATSAAFVIIIIAMAFWVWKRRAQNRRILEEHIHPLATTPWYEHEGDEPQADPSFIASSPRGTTPVVARYGDRKHDLLNRLIVPISEHSFTSVNHLLSPTHESGSITSTPITAASVISGEECEVVGEEHLGKVGRSRSISARTLARTLAPHLSQQDINRLADTIVARMQVGVPVVSPHGDDLLPGGSDTGQDGDPPPPWRASWNGNERPT